MPTIISGTLNISGETSSGLIVEGTLNVLAGGTAIGTTVEFIDAQEVIFAGGVASATAVNQSSSEIISSGGKAFATTVEGASAAELVMSGGMASGTVVTFLGAETVFAGGTAIGTILLGGGQDVIGTAIATTISGAPGLQDIGEDGIASGTVVAGGGGVDVGGTAIGTTVNFNGEEVADDGGTAVGTTVNFNGLQTVKGGSGSGVFSSPGGTAVNTTVNSGGEQDVNGLAFATMVNNSGQQLVSSGGTASGTFVNSGAEQDVRFSGTAVGTIVTKDGFALIFIGGVVSSTIIGGGTEELEAGAIARGVITFAGTGGTLAIDAPTSGGMPTNTISGFTPGNTIDLAAVGFDINGSITLQAGNVLQITENSQTYTLHFDPAQNFAGWKSELSAQGVAGTNIRLDGQLDDFNRDRVSDILFRNDSTGDTWVETISNGGSKSWNQIGSSSTSFAEVGVGDFYGTGTADALFRNNTTGDTWIETISNAGL